MRRFKHFLLKIKKWQERPTFSTPFQYLLEMLVSAQSRKKKEPQVAKREIKTYLQKQTDHIYKILKSQKKITC